MGVQELTKTECQEVLSESHIGRLGCVRDSQPYVIPVQFAYHDHWLYSFSTLGQKIDYMRANPLVCVEADQSRSGHWTTVVVLGTYEELCDTPELHDERALAYNLLQQRAMWWERGGMTDSLDGAPMTPIYYRIKINDITGRRSSFAMDTPGLGEATPN